MTIRSLTPTLTRLFGLATLRPSTDACIERVMKAAKELNISRIEKCLVFCPDAIGKVSLEKNTEVIKRIRKIAPIEIPIESVFPSVTPVCFASMFTGLSPEEHGIRKYERPILKCETVFDILISNGIKVAIIAVKNSSIDIIFRGRDIAYYSEEYDEEVRQRALGLFKEYDFIVVYQQSYDDTLHKIGPYSAKAFQALFNHVRDFTELGESFNNNWSNYDRCIIFAPDHGAHYDVVKKKGTHGENIEEDMDLLHFFGIHRSSGI